MDIIVGDDITHLNAASSIGFGRRYPQVMSEFININQDLDQDGFPMAQYCDDNNPEINPRQTEIPNNGIDDDCSDGDMTLSVQEFTENVSINIYPNPAINILNINISGQLENYSSSLYNLEERLIKKSIKTIELSNISTGIYILKIIDQQ